MLKPVTRTFVVARAGNRCEYCRMPQEEYEATFPVDHIIATQHQPDDSTENLAYCCPRCNRKKGPNLAGIDPVTGKLAPLFHPRRDGWTDHFRWEGPLIAGLTPVARATIVVLDLNNGDRIRLREELIAKKGSLEG